MPCLSKRTREALWTFVQVEGVEPTHNTAERFDPCGGAMAQGQLWDPE
jgi:hypothetical protein